MSVRSRNAVLSLLAAALFCIAATSARAADDLYDGQAIVTGQREPERVRALPDCLEDVLVKVSADPGLIGDRRLAPLKAKAGDFLASFPWTGARPRLAVVIRRSVPTASGITQLAARPGTGTVQRCCDIKAPMTGLGQPWTARTLAAG
jgi:hypothetical protein